MRAAELEALRHKQDAAWKEREEEPRKSEAQRRADLRAFVAGLHTVPGLIDPYVLRLLRAEHTASIGRSNGAPMSRQEQAALQDAAWEASR